MSKSNTSLSTAQVTQGLDADLASKPAAAQAARGLNADLASILDSLEGAEAIKLKFKEEEIYTLARARSLTEKDLVELGFKMGKRKDILEALHPASGPAPAQPSEQTAPLTPMKNHEPTGWAPSPTTTTAIKAVPVLIQEFLKENKELNRKAREELKEELNAQILRLAPPVTMSAGTAAARVEDLEKTHRLRRNVEPHWMQHLQCMPSTEDPWAKVLPSGSCEQKVVQPHVSTVLAMHACLPTKLRMMDTHKRISFLTRKPDICVYPAGCCSEETQPSSWYLIALRDVKERREKAEFDNDEIGKIIDFLQDLLRVRPDRRTVTGFLTDSCFIQFITLTVVLSATRVEIAWVDLTPVYSLVRGNATRGGDRLYTLLMQEPPELGLPFSELSVDNAVLSITRYLGEGSSSVVWQGTHPTAGDVVVKMFREGHEKDLEKERENLGKVANLAGVTKLVGVNKDSRILLLSPVGTPFHARRQGGAVLPKAQHFAQLLDIVENSHKPPITLLHRDLSLNNFFIAPGGRVFLNDWAAAVPLHEAHHFYGALFFAADAVLTAHDTKLVGLPRHDLEMIVKVMFAAVHPEFFDERFAALDMHKKQDAELAVKRWAQVRKMEHWRLLFAAAEEANYALLKELIRKYLPRGDEPQESDTAVPAAAQPLPSVLGAVRPQLASGGDSPPEVRTWEEFEKKVTSLWDTCSFVDHGGYPDCFFHCVLALLDRSLIPAGVIATTKQLRATLADQLATRASPPDNFNFIRDTVVQTQPLLAGLVNDWKEYLNRLRDGSLYGGDLEVSAVVEWMKSRGRKLRIRVWTPARAEPQDHGAEDAETVWQLALMQAHYRVVKFMREEQKP